jgi:hypothetical protein
MAKNVMYMNLYSQFGIKYSGLLGYFPDFQAMSNMTSQLRNIHKMKKGRQLATPDTSITIVDDKGNEHKFYAPRGFTRAGLLVRAIKAVRKSGGVTGHYNSQVVIEGIRRSRATGKYRLEIGT